MRIQSKLLSLLAASMGALGAACHAADAAPWTETLTCGNTTYKLESFCKKAKSENDLNECTKQTLEIRSHDHTRKVTLPELDKFAAGKFKQAQGDLAELFVTNWACGKSGDAAALALLYSTGSGNSEASESGAAYDPDGVLLEHGTSEARFGKALADGYRNLKPVRSLMPR